MQLQKANLLSSSSLKLHKKEVGCICFNENELEFIRFFEIARRHCKYNSVTYSVVPFPTFSFFYFIFSAYLFLYHCQQLV